MHISLSTNEVYWYTLIPTGLRVACVYFGTLKARWRSCGRDHQVTKSKLFTFWHFTEKVADPTLHSLLPHHLNE